MLLIVPAKPLDAKKRADEIATEKIIINDLNFFSKMLLVMNLIIIFTKPPPK